MVVVRSTTRPRLVTCCQNRKTYRQCTVRSATAHRGGFVLKYDECLHQRLVTDWFHYILTENCLISTANLPPRDDINNIHRIFTTYLPQIHRKLCHIMPRFCDFFPRFSPGDRLVWLELRTLSWIVPCLWGPTKRSPLLNSPPPPPPRLVTKRTCKFGVVLLMLLSMPWGIGLVVSGSKPQFLLLSLLSRFFFLSVRFCSNFQGWRIMWASFWSQNCTTNCSV